MIKFKKIFWNSCFNIDEIFIKIGDILIYKSADRLNDLDKIIWLKDYRRSTRFES